MDTGDWLAHAALAVVQLLSFVPDVRQFARSVVGQVRRLWRRWRRRGRGTDR